MAQKIYFKDKKIKIYYAERATEGENNAFRRRFIHSQKSGGLWAFVRDLSQAEIIAIPTADAISTLVFIVNYNKRIIEHWRNPVWIMFRDKTYRINAKPDEFNYSYGDIRLYCTEIVDNTIYEGDIYDV